MEVFRLAREKYATPLSGKGAALKGARWNSVGVELIYAAANRSLAVAEVAVHFTLATLPDDYLLMTIWVPDDLPVLEILEEELPAQWRNFPHPAATQPFGDEFVQENKYGLLKIPSVVTIGDFNYLTNPNHREFGRLKIVEIEKFPFGKRIFR